ncbi:Transcription factor [Neofusicoccum parvum]|uniref:Transcription factor n=1 Tax=Neofusicoccum parvum TaxID=310453 RepID=A0ACB5S5D4_9PEZI|nr:Transcription factor [Neofusicoccum parvum]
MAEVSGFIEQQNTQRSIFRTSPAPVRPDAGVINRFVQLYFEYFHPVLPFLHKPTFNERETPWLLVLAVATVGGHYARGRSSTRFVSTLREYLRRAIVISIEGGRSNPLQVWFAQVVLLSHISMVYSGKKELVLATLYQRNLLNMLCKGISAGFSHHGREFSRMPSVEDWLDTELAARVVHATWLLDCQHSLHCDLPPPSTSPRELEPPLPCAEDIWNTPVEHVDKPPQEPLTMQEALHLAHRGAGDPFPRVGEFARRIVVTAVYYESRVVLQAAASLQQSGALAHIMGASGMDRAQLPSADPIATDAVYSCWRRSAAAALACLGPPAACHGAEHSTLAQQLLHYVSIRLYVPLTRLCALTGWMASERATAHARGELIRWIRLDGESARRAVMHAAKLFALLRRRAVGSYFEAHYVLLATLTMWAYALLEPEAVDQDSRARASSRLPAASRVIRLDAIGDAQTEHWWTVEGIACAPNVGGVGSIQGRAGALRVVGEAQRLLLQRGAWPISQKFARVLGDLAAEGRTGDR